MTSFFQRLIDQANGTARTARLSSGRSLTPSFAPNELPLGQVLPEPANRFPPNDEREGELAHFDEQAFRAAPAPPEIRQGQRAREALATNSLADPAPMVAHGVQRHAASPIAPNTLNFQITGRMPAPVQSATGRSHHSYTEHGNASQPESDPDSSAAISNETAITTPPKNRVSPGDFDHIPTLLAPIQPALKPSVFDPGMAPQRGTPAKERQETTEVHVSIGRIEVTAVHEPTLPVRTQSRRSTLMSLDEYLTKRKEARS